jgi:hypothetical protein
MLCPVIVPCGLGELEFTRLVDLARALSFWEPEAWLIIVNDSNQFISNDALLKNAPELEKLRIDILDNPRFGRGWGWSGGLVLGELAALRFIHEKAQNVPFIIKCDSDALPIASFSEKLALLFESPSVGLVGSHVIDEKLGPNRTTPPIGYFRKKIRKMCAPLALWRKPRWHLRSPIWDERTRKLRALILKAIENGYTPGELIEGGALAFSPWLVEAICDSNLDREEELILHLCVSDDLFLTPLAYFHQMKAIHSEMFCIEPFALRHPPEKLRDKCPQAAWIHSLKGSTPEYEVAARKMFNENNHT